MADITIKGKDGQPVGTHAVSEKLTTVRVSMTTLHRAVVAEEANKRQGTQKAKTRSEVRGGGRKPYKQKKTGNARQGTVSAPQYTHGGMALAVSPRDYSKKQNKRERRNAILAAFSAHLEAGNVQVIDTLTFATPRTKDATALLGALGLAEQKRVLIILPAYDEVVYKSFRNLPNVEVRTAPSTEADAKTQAFSTRDLLVARKIIVAQEALAKIEEVWAK
ncbi:50S ribosomal protein L4 [bacterium]|nr:MAG: 50S ribosomal protein L4 [bacterium]